jgi:FSR family fosmidomycin resistance protein-like MFS transporter
MIDHSTKKVLAISTGHFVHDIFTSIIPAVAFLLKDSFHLSYFELTLLIVVSKLPGLLNPLLSTWIDRVGLRYFVILPPLTTALLISLIGLAPNYITLLFLLFFTGISTQAFHVPAPVLVKNFSKQSADAT